MTRNMCCDCWSVMALFLVYALLASQFESFFDPVFIIIAVPAALVGVLLVTVLSGGELNSMVFLGGIMLCGIVVMICLTCACRRLRMRMRAHDASCACARAPMTKAAHCHAGP